MSEIRPRDSKYKNIMIAGGGKIGRRLAKVLEDKFSVVKIIEKSRKRGDYLSENLILLWSSMAILQMKIC